jgi:hypothetical protein
VITGAGRRFFCAGADLKGFYSSGTELKSRVSVFHAVLSRLARADFPVIAGRGGMPAPMAWRIVAASARVIAAHVGLLRWMGRARAHALNRSLSAEEALSRRCFGWKRSRCTSSDGEKYLIDPNKVRTLTDRL